MSLKLLCVCCTRHHIQHYTNQLAKETNQYIRDLAHLPQTNLSPSELVTLIFPVFCVVLEVC